VFCLLDWEVISNCSSRKDQQLSWSSIYSLIFIGKCLISYSLASD